MDRDDFENIFHKPYEEINPRLIGKEYEKLMRKIYPKQKTNRNGVDFSKMMCLVDTERGNKYYRQPSRSKQKERMRTYVYKAVDKLKGKAYDERFLNELLDIEEDIEYSHHSTQFCALIGRLCDLIREKE
ncbi:hypothetical protein [Echinicola rosea]|uniref:CRISPR type III A-associated protein Csm2 n=1 Tax=Echinicola rosea TaxID=1807691 RepID=A0ABQ1V8W6_9BACT|nr:hypothetical protein [Echinicola rosea]GGF44233.1 hypothetical protein GCM10011339_35910 [Echinicola rosea]